MVERAVFLDRDNTIIDNDGYLGDPSKVKLLPGAATALSAMRALGYRLIVVSNQSGVARGMFDEAAVEAVNQEMSRQLQEQAGAYIDASYYCPYHPEAPIAEYRIDHDWRKPKCGMLKQAGVDFNLDLSQSWMIGDQGRDVAAGVAAGSRTILLRDPDRTPAAEPDAEMTVSPNFIVRTLADAARIIAREGRNVQAPASASNVDTPSASHAGATEATQAAAPVAPVPIDAQAVADRVSERLSRQAAHVAPTASSTKLERTLEELVTQIRQQNRHADLRPDFSFGKLGALILQVFAVVALFLGLRAYATAPRTFTVGNDLFLSEIAHQSAMIWLITALIFQGMVIALLIRARQR